MSYRAEREQFIARMTNEGLDLATTLALLRAATTLQRYAELACSSETADRDRVCCPADTFDLHAHPRKPSGPCCCDGQNGAHASVPRITVADHRLEARVRKGVPAGWAIDTQGDPRGYVLRIIPPSYAERNAGRDCHNLDAIGVPSGPTGLRF